MPGTVLDAKNIARTRTDVVPIATELRGGWRDRQEHRWLQYSMISIMIGEVKGTIGSVLNKNAT